MAALTERPSKIDAPLARFHATRAPGRTYSCREIAAACGCRHTLIHAIERKAFRRLRRDLQAILQELRAEATDDATPGLDPDFSAA